MPREVTSVENRHPFWFSVNCLIMRALLLFFSFPWIPKTRFQLSGLFLARNQPKSFEQNSTEAQVLKNTILLLLTRQVYRKKNRNLIFSMRLGINIQVLLRLPGIVQAEVIYQTFCSLLGFDLAFDFSDFSSGLGWTVFKAILARFLIPQNQQSFCYSPCRVAENIAVLLIFCTARISSLMPFSLSTRSASSMQRQSTFLSQFDSKLPASSLSLPTVPINTMAFFPTSSMSSLIQLPPVAHLMCSRYAWPLFLSGRFSSSFLITEQVCWQSSRVGEISINLMKIFGGGTGKARYLSRRGMTKASVLPEPVWASTAKSQFLSMRGTAADWTGTGSLKLHFSRDSTISCLSYTWSYLHLLLSRSLLMWGSIIIQQLQNRYQVQQQFLACCSDFLSSLLQRGTLLPWLSDCTPLASTLVASFVNICSILESSFADASTNYILNRSASSSPCLQDTLRSSLRSLFEPTKIIVISAFPVYLICSTHFSMCWQLAGSITEQVSTIPCAPLQNDLVMLRKRSCPAVSQMFKFSCWPSISTRLILKSTPMVLRQSVWKVSSQQRTSKLVLPTPLSPTTRNFSVVLFCFDINYKLIQK